MEQHPVLNGLTDSGYAGIYDSSKVGHLLKGIKTTDLEVCNTQVMATTSLRDYFASILVLYSTLIKHTKAENPQLNVSEVIFSRGKGGKNSFGRGVSSGISNVSNSAVDECFFEKHEYHALIPEKNKTLHLERLKCGHVGKDHGGNGNEKGNGNSKGPTLKSLNRSIVALATNFDKFNLPNDDDDDDDEEE
jgi:hypothetical protein